MLCNEKFKKAEADPSADSRLISTTLLTIPGEASKLLVRYFHCLCIGHRGAIFAKGFSVAFKRSSANKRLTPQPPTESGRG